RELWLELGKFAIGDRVRESRRPAAGLEALRPLSIRHHVVGELILQAEGGGEDIEVLRLLLRREVAQRLVGLRETEDLLAREERRDGRVEMQEGRAPRRVAA